MTPLAILEVENEVGAFYVDSAELAMIWVPSYRCSAYTTFATPTRTWTLIERKCDGRLARIG